MSVLRLPPLPSVKEILKIYKLGARKQLAQNFLLDENIINKIIRKSGYLADRHVLEVGPGPGGLTRSIMKQCPKRIIVVEKDERFRPTLEMLAEAFETVNGKMDIIFDDVLQLNMETLVPEDEKRSWEDSTTILNIIGNLPFNVSIPLIIQWLHAISERRGPWALGRTRMTLTFQKEVAERLVAIEGHPQRCRLSVIAQTWTRPVLRFVIPGKVFVPQPDVDVGVVTFVPLANPHTKHDFEVFEKVTRHIFSFRQKYSIKAAETLFPLDCRKEMSQMMYKLSDVEPSVRPFRLTVKEMDRLVTAYTYLVERHPELGLYEYRASRRILPRKYTKNIFIEQYTEP